MSVIDRQTTSDVEPGEDVLYDEACEALRKNNLARLLAEVEAGRMPAKVANEAIDTYTRSQGKFRRFLRALVD